MDKEGLHPATGQGQAHPGYILALERGSGKIQIGGAPQPYQLM